MTNPNVFGISDHKIEGRSTAAVAIVSAALILGLAGDVLLRARPLGLNGTLWLAGLCALALVLPLVPSLRIRRPRGSLWLCAAVVFAVMLVWRSSPVLQALNLIAAFVCLQMVAFRTSGRGLRLAGIAEFGTNVAVSGAHVVVGMLVLVARYIDWPSAVSAGRFPRVVAIARGLAIAVVPVVVFGALFISADVFFRDLVRGVFFIDPGQLVSHLALWAAFSWVAGSCLWSALLAERAAAPGVPRAAWLRLGFIETTVVFGLTNALFLAFVAVQFRYLFGGADRVESSLTLTYAEYARRGFFELVAVAALAVPFLLFTHWLLPRSQLRLHRFYAFAALVLVALVFVVMASALQRMRLYQETFGLTELRLYTTAFMLWLFGVFVWLAMTVLRRQRERFTFGIVLAALAAVIALNAVNPDAYIVSRNASAADADVPFDTAYAVSLSADAVPTIIANFEAVAPADRCSVASRLRQRYLDSSDDWRSWSWSRWRARSAIRSSDQLAGACD